MRRGEHVFAIVTALVIGILAAYGAIGFRLLIRLSHQVFFGTTEYSLQILNTLPWWQRLLFPALGGLGVGIIVTRVASEVKGSGIPEVMEAVALRSGAIRLRVLAAKAVAAALTIGSGGSAGREGPIVHIGSTIGSLIGQVLEVSARRLRTFVGCGAAAAIAATFNAPIAGALFSVEVVLGDFGVASFAPIVIAAVVATVISRHHLGDFPAFQVPGYELVHPGELVLYGGMGLIAGAVAVAFIRTLYGVGDVFERSRVPPWLRPASGGLLVGGIALGLPQVFGVGYETINDALLGGSTGVILLLLVIAKLGATSITLGSGGSGGVFAPSLFMGACLGAGLGHVFHSLFPSWTAGPGAYSLVGMGALVAATTHAPVSGILIIFELTNDYTIIPPLMLACVLALLTSSRLHRESIYAEKLKRRGIHLAEGRDVNLLRSMSVRDVMNTDPPTVPADLPFPDLVARLLAAPHPELLVVDPDRTLLGTVALTDVREMIPESESLGALIVAADAIQEESPFLLPDDNLDLGMHLFGRTRKEELPVCADARSRRLVGVVTRHHVIDAYNRKIFQLDLAGGFESLVAGVGDGRSVEVLAGLQLAEVEVPFALVGRTLRDADLRRRWGVEVVLIHTHATTPEELEGRPGRIPGPESRLEAGDRLLVMGTEEAIRRLRAGEAGA